MLDEEGGHEAWALSALCRDHSHPDWWVSDDYVEVENAKAVCLECPVKVQCIINAVSDSDMEDMSLPAVGVYAGMSKLDMLMCIWERVDDVSESNWSRPDKVVETVIQREG